jgi:proteasome assembly chaperone (PAC2) family protein
MFRQQVVIEKDGVVKIVREQFDGALRFDGDVEVVSGETQGEPIVASLIVVKEKDADRTARS